MSKGGFRPNSGRKKGSVPWNKDIPMSKASKLRVSKSKKGTPAWNKGLRMPSVAAKMKGNTNGTGNKGRKMGRAWLKKLRLAKLGKPSPNKGRKLPIEWVEKIAKTKRGKNHSPELREKNRQGQYRRYLKVDPNYKVTTRNKRIADNDGFHSDTEWESLKKDYDFTCPACRKSEPEIKLTRDHILPLLKGGTNDIKNIQPLCHQCNRKKHTQTIKY